MKTNRIKNNNAVLTWEGHQSFHCVFVIFVFVVILFDHTKTCTISAGSRFITLLISSNNTLPSEVIVTDASLKCPCLNTVTRHLPNCT